MDRLISLYLVRPTRFLTPESHARATKQQVDPTTGIICSPSTAQRTDRCAHILPSSADSPPVRLMKNANEQPDFAATAPAVAAAGPEAVVTPRQPQQPRDEPTQPASGSATDHDSNNNSRTAPSSLKLRPEGTGITIHGWDIHSTDGPIASSHVDDQLSKQLDMKLPSMLYDESVLTLRHVSSGFTLSFDAVGALRMVSKADPGIRVKAAVKWRGHHARDDVEVGSVSGRWHDWTFTTTYQGGIDVGQHQPEDGDGDVGQKRVAIDNTNDDNNNNNNSNSNNASVSDNDGGVDKVKTQNGNKCEIDYDALRDTSLPILFSAQNILFEDELDDNGVACYKVRIRVMPSFFFILARFFLRVDGVLVRVYDTRYFFKFGTPAMVRETIHRQASIPQSLQHLHVSVLRDPDLLASKLPVVLKSVENIGIPLPLPPASAAASAVNSTSTTVPPPDSGATR